MNQPETTSRSWIVLAVACAIYLLGLALSAPKLPERMASHFGISGTANDWMSREAYLVLMAAAGLGMTALFSLISWTMRTAPASAMNLPHKEYWLAPERRAATGDELVRRFVWFASMTLMFLLVVHLLVVQANNSEPARLSNAIWVWLAVFLAFTVVWIVSMVRHFSRVPA